MASVPARPPSQRRSSPERSQLSSNTSHHSRSPIRARSEDSQTIFVHKGDEKEGEDEQQQGQQEEQQETNPTVPLLSADDDPSVKKCWICFSDSTEDTPETSPWRDPCPCALVAHEECLLDWIADTESPKNARNRGITAPKIECPQCKAEIRLARPTDYLVDVVRSLERAGAKLVTPGAIVALSGIVYSSSMAWGMHSIYAIFGPEDGFRILRPLLYNATRAPIEVYVDSPRRAAKQVLMVMLDHLVHWRLYIGLPLVTPILILSRTSLADGILPVLPILFFASQASAPYDTIEVGKWPPSASFAFAVLPYVRSLYKVYYQKIWAEKERGWMKEIQPRSNQNQNDGVAGGDNANQGAQARDGNEEQNVFEVRIDGGIWEDWEDAEPIPDAPPAVADAAPAPDVPRGAQQEAQLGANDAAAAAAAAPGGERRLSFSPTAIAENVLGALLFPTLAGLTGEALKLLLPASWTAPPAVSSRFGSRLSPKGLLQQRWGRSLVGGCLFVVCKDAIMLYVRWKMALMHRKRRVVDYERRKK